MSKVDPKALIRIHQLQLKEMEEVDDYSKMFQADRKITVKPADGELSYGAFVAALIKVCSIRH